LFVCVWFEEKVVCVHVRVFWVVGGCCGGFLCLIFRCLCEVALLGFVCCLGCFSVMLWLWRLFLGFPLFSDYFKIFPVMGTKNSGLFGCLGRFLMVFWLIKLFLLVPTFSSV
jgi:hypothetical protein